MNWLRVFLAFFVLLALPVAPAAAQDHSNLRVTVSIRPLHALATMVMGDVAQPSLLMDGVQSPHQFNLRTGQAEMIDNAKLVVWMGPQLESFLRKPMETIADAGRSLPLIEHRLKSRSGSESDSFGLIKAADIHAWLDPEFALKAIDLLVDRLAVLDPKNASVFRANGASAKAEIENAIKAMKETATGLKGKSYAVMHNAFGALEDYLDIGPGIPVSTSPHSKPGAKQVRRIHSLIEQHEIECVFFDPGTPASMIKLITADGAIPHAVLDPLGTEFQPGKRLYIDLLQSISASMRECLTSS